MMRAESIITGAGLVTALGHSPNTLHRYLCGGKSAVKAVSGMNDREVSPTRPAAPLVGFDPKPFLGGQNFNSLDRSGQLSITAVNLALKDSGWTSERLEETEMDLVLGTMFCNIRTIIQFDRSVLETGPKYAKPLDFANTVINAAGGQTAIWHNLRGANTTVAGGKVSGLRAIRHARLQQERGGTAPVIVGGMEALSFEMMVIFGQAGVLADSVERARPFLKNRAGFALGEGAGFIVLESGESAHARGAHVRGRVLGMGSSYDISRGADPENAIDRLVDSIRQALTEANVAESDLDFVISSANGSPKEDTFEMSALERIFENRPEKIPVMSLAGHIGETLGASGLLQVISGLEILRTGTFPGSGATDLDLLSLTIPVHTICGTYRHGLVISLGLDGSSNALILAGP